MTLDKLRDQIEAAKAKARENFDVNHGRGAFDRLAAYSASDANRRALDHIASVAPRK